MLDWGWLNMTRKDYIASVNVVWNALPISFNGTISEYYMNEATNPERLFIDRLLKNFIAWFKSDNSRFDVKKYTNYFWYGNK